MIIKQMQVGYIQANCYIIIDEETNKGFVIDPGGNYKDICNLIKANGWKPEYILITHGHFDHIMDMDKVKQELNIPTVVLDLEENCLKDPSLNLSGLICGKQLTYSADIILKENEYIKSGNLSFKAINVSGHTEGGTCFYEEKEKVIFSGDSLFELSVGRTDFKGGNQNKLINDVKTKLMKLPDDVIVYPGHGPSTTIKNERDNNPYLKENNIWEF